MTGLAVISNRSSLVNMTGNRFFAASLHNPSRYLIDIEFAGQRVATKGIDPSGAFYVSVFRVARKWCRSNISGVKRSITSSLDVR
jgi:hypothetical protein